MFMDHWHPAHYVTICLDTIMSCIVSQWRYMHTVPQIRHDTRTSLDRVLSLFHCRTYWLTGTLNTVVHVDIGYTSHHYLDIEIHDIEIHVHGYTNMLHWYTTRPMHGLPHFISCHVYILLLHLHVMFTYYCYTCMSCLHIIVTFACHVFISLLHRHIMFTYHCYTCMLCFHRPVTSACMLSLLLS